MSKIIEEIAKHILMAEDYSTSAQMACKLIKDNNIILTELGKAQTTELRKTTYTKYSLSKYILKYDTQCEKCSQKITAGSKYYFLDNKKIHISCNVLGKAQTNVLYKVQTNGQSDKVQTTVFNSVFENYYNFSIRQFKILEVLMNKNELGKCKIYNTFSKGNHDNSFIKQIDELEYYKLISKKNGPNNSQIYSITTMGKEHIKYYLRHNKSNVLGWAQTNVLSCGQTNLTKV